MAVVAMAPNVDGPVGNEGRAKDSQWTPHRPTGVALGTFPHSSTSEKNAGGIWGGVPNPRFLPTSQSGCKSRKAALV